MQRWRPHFTCPSFEHVCRCSLPIAIAFANKPTVAGPLRKDLLHVLLASLQASSEVAARVASTPPLFQLALDLASAVSSAAGEHLVLSARPKRILG